jgi:type IV pilus assembly protein PilV
MLNRRRPDRGFTLIEVLVTVVVLVFGLLGMVALQARAGQAEFESYQRKQALILLQDMVDRMMANKTVMSCYAFSATGGSPVAGTGASLPNCTAGSLQAQAVANADLQQWSDALLGAAEVKGGSNVGAMINARGCIMDNGGNVYTVMVAWEGTVKTSAPAAALTCGAGLYGDEALRRVVSITVRPPTLL